MSKKKFSRTFSVSAHTLWKLSLVSLLVNIMSYFDVCVSFQSAKCCPPPAVSRSSPMTMTIIRYSAHQTEKNMENSDKWARLKAPGSLSRSLLRKKKEKTCIEMRSPPQPALSFPRFVTVPDRHTHTHAPHPPSLLFSRIICSDPSCVCYCAARWVRCFDDDDAPLI